MHFDPFALNAHDFLLPIYLSALLPTDKVLRYETQLDDRVAHPENHANLISTTDEKKNSNSVLDALTFTFGPARAVSGT